jgi:hypothetical protein
MEADQYGECASRAGRLKRQEGETMQQDPLAKWRGQQQPQESPPVDTEKYSRILQSADLHKPAGDPEQYMAYGEVKERPQTRLLIRRLTEVSMAPDYRLLSNIVFNDYGNEIELWYPFMRVIVKGRNLALVTEALVTHSCVFIRDYDAREWPKPLKEGQPVITAIEINVTDRAEQARHEVRPIEGGGLVLELDQARSEMHGRGPDGGVER